MGPDDAAGGGQFPGYSGRFFGRRIVRHLKGGRQKAFDDDLPRLAIVLPEGDSVLLDPSSLFPRMVTSVWLEIGFGAGEHLLAQAESHPEIGFIGCEPFTNGVAALLAGRSRLGLDNIRVFPDDAAMLLPKLPTASLSRIFLLFADPWPKRRHHHRRFVSEQTLDAFAGLLVDGGELRFATDHPHYALSTLELVHAKRQWIDTAAAPADWHIAPDDWVETRYERKAKERGDLCYYFQFKRKTRGKTPEEA